MVKKKPVRRTGGKRETDWEREAEADKQLFLFYISVGGILNIKHCNNINPILNVNKFLLSIRLLCVCVWLCAIFSLFLSLPLSPVQKIENGSLHILNMIRIFISKIANAFRQDINVEWKCVTDVASHVREQGGSKKMLCGLKSGQSHHL